MGRCVTCNYEVQVLQSDESLSIQGAMSHKEAKDKLLKEALRIGSNLGYIWPQTETGKRKIYPSDYQEVIIDNGKIFSITGNVIEWVRSI
jgi:hypothetical protein